MQQATEKDTEAPNIPLSPFYDSGSPSDTLVNCARVVRFMGRAFAAIENQGNEIGEDEVCAIWGIMMSVADVLQYEAKQVQFKRKGL